MAQANLVSVLQVMNANGPAAAILRPTLRDAARKSIGDTGEPSCVCIVLNANHTCSSRHGRCH